MSENEVTEGAREETAEIPAEQETPTARGPELRRVRGATVIHAATAVALSGVVAYLCFRLLGERALAADEATSFFIAHLDWARLWESLATSEANGSPFYISLHYWIGLGDGESSLRILPAIFGVITVPTLFLLARRLFGFWPAVCASVLLTVNGFFIAQARDLRSYSMATFLVTLSTLLLVRVVERPDRARWAAYVPVSALAVYAHFFSGFVIAAHLVTLMFVRKEKRWWWKFAGAYAGLALLVAPAAYFVLFNDVGQVDWIAPLTLRRFKVAVLGLTGMQSRPLAVAYFAIAGLSLVPAVWTWLTKRRSDDGWKYILALSWMVFPIAGAAAVSVLIKPLFIGRYLMVGLPGLAFAAALGAGALGPRWRGYAWIAAPVTAVAVLVAMPGLMDRYEDKGDFSWQAKADQVRAVARPGDAVVFYAPTVIRPFGYYAGYYRAEGGASSSPPPIYPELYWLGYSATRYEPDYGALGRAISEHERVWFVSGYARDRPRQKELARMRLLLGRSCDGPPGIYFRGTVVLHTGCAR